MGDGLNTTGLSYKEEKEMDGVNPQKVRESALPVWKMAMCLLKQQWFSSVWSFYWLTLRV